MWTNPGLSAVLLIGLTACCVVGKPKNNNHDADCSQLSDNIKAEVHSYQKVANQIIHEIVNGKYKGIVAQK